MKKNYIQPKATCVTIDITNVICDSGDIFDSLSFGGDGNDIVSEKSGRGRGWEDYEQ